MRVRGFASGGKEEWYERGTITHRMMDPKYSNSFCIWGFYVEEVEFPQGLREVQWGFGEMGDVIFNESIWVFYVRIYFGNYDVVV